MLSNAAMFDCIRFSLPEDRLGVDVNFSHFDVKMVRGAQLLMRCENGVALALHFE